MLLSNDVDKLNYCIARQLFDEVCEVRVVCRTRIMEGPDSLLRLPYLNQKLGQKENLVTTLGAERK